MDFTQQGIVIHLELWNSSKAIVIQFWGGLVRRPFPGTRSRKRPPLVEVLSFIFILIPWIFMFAKLVSDSIFGYQVFINAFSLFMLFKAFTSILFLPVNSVWFNRRIRNRKHTFWLLKLLRIRSCQVYLSYGRFTNSRLYCLFFGFDGGTWPLAFFTLGRYGAFWIWHKPSLRKLMTQDIHLV